MDIRVIATLFQKHTAKKCLIICGGMWMDECSDKLFSLKKNEIIIHAPSWMFLKDIMLIIQARHKGHVYPMTFVLGVQNSQIQRDKMENRAIEKCRIRE